MKLNWKIKQTWLVTWAILAAAACNDQLTITEETPMPIPVVLDIAVDACGSNCYDLGISRNPLAATAAERSATSKLRVFSNHNLATGSSTTRNLIFLVHDLGYRAENALNSMQRAITSASRPDTIVVSALFANSSRRPSNDHFYWTSAAWRYGGNAENVENNSFRLADIIINQLFKPSSFPMINRVVVVGHSAGAQFSHRYAASHRPLPNLSTANFSYIVANPSSYVYLSDVRVNSDGMTFSPPTSTNSCSGSYDNYQYGLANHADAGSRFDYDRNLSLATIRAQMKARNVIYLLGQNDHTSNTTATTDCPSSLQGTLRSRLNRGRTYFQYMESQYSPHSHQIIEVPNVGHNANAMYNAPVTIALLRTLLTTR